MMERGWLSRESALAFAASGLLFSLPALFLPFVTLQQFGHVRTTYLTVGFFGFWSHGFSVLGAWVLFCGTLAPMALLGLLTVILASHGRKKYSEWHRRARDVAEVIEYWAMPEVQVLGVMVAFFKLGSIVTIRVGPGLWCYSAASLCLLVAWRLFSFRPEFKSPAAGWQEVRA